ncbi:MAG: hypothetical protein WA865_22815 [Spirulinaceae cyanobacterium]
MNTPNDPKETAIVPPSEVKETAITSVSEETKDLVNKKMGDGESDEVKEKMGELIEAIKKQAASQIEAAGDMNRENYVDAMTQAQETLRKTEKFFEGQKNSVETSLAELTNEATENWEVFVDEMQKMGKRIDNAVNAAWKAFTESEPK